MKDSQFYILSAYLTAIFALHMSDISFKVGLMGMAFFEIIYAVIAIIKEK